MRTGFMTGVLLALLAGFLNGIFLLPMRYTRRWAWENTWLIFSLMSTVVGPWVAASLAVPNLLAVFRQSPFSFFIPGLISGFIWGIAQVLYGLGLGMVGIAIGNAIVAGLTTLAGTIGPMITYAPEKLFTSAGLIFLAAISLVVLGISLYGKAGVRRERETAGLEVAKQVVHGSFRTGLITCLVSAPLGTAFIYGLGSSTGLLKAAEAAGAKPLFAGYTAWVITFNTGFFPSLIYCLYLLRKNRSTSAYLKSGYFVWNSLLACLMAAMWFSAILMYGMAAMKMGRLGPSVGFALFVSGTVLFGSLFGWLAGEWKGASQHTVQQFLTAMTLIVIAVFVIAFGVSRTA